MQRILCRFLRINFTNIIPGIIDLHYLFLSYFILREDSMILKTEYNFRRPYE